MIARSAARMICFGLHCTMVIPCVGQQVENERSLFGASMGNYWPGNIETDLKFFRLMQDAGVTHAGLGFNWDNIEKHKGRYNWDPWDYAIDIAARFGIRMEGVIVGCPEWALPTSGDLGWLPVALNMPREDCVADFERFVSELGKRYAGKVEMFTFWNEPNGYNMAPTVGEKDPRYPDKIKHYTRFLKIAYAALKKGNPKAVLACGGIDSGGKSGTWLTGLYENGARDFMDAVAIHPYTNDPPYFDEGYLRNTRAIMDRYGDRRKGIWMNEYGVHNPNGKVIHAAFDTVRQKYPYVTEMMLHTFQDFQGGSGLEPWGLIDLSLNIKPTGGYEAFKNYPKPPPSRPPRLETGPCKISGRLVDVQTQRPITGSYVLAMPGAYVGRTDKEGIYTIDGLPAGDYRVSASAPGMNRTVPVQIAVSKTTGGTADFHMTRDILPLGESETFDPAKDSADGMRLNLVENGSFDQVQEIQWGQIGVGWYPCNTVQRLTYRTGAGTGGTGLSQKMGHDGSAVQQGIYQVVETAPGQRYRLTFWFAYTGQGRVADPNNCSRLGIDLNAGEWATTDPKTGTVKYGFPKTLRWLTADLPIECDRRAGGLNKGEGKWYRFVTDFVAAQSRTSIWFEGAADEGQRSRKYFDEISVIPNDE